MNLAKDSYDIYMNPSHPFGKDADVELFYLRNPLAAFNKDTKQLCIYWHKIYEVMWDREKEDAADFMIWLSDKIGQSRS